MRNWRPLLPHGTLHAAQAAGSHWTVVHIGVAGHGLCRLPAEHVPPHSELSTGALSADRRHKQVVVAVTLAVPQVAVGHGDVEHWQLYEAHAATGQGFCCGGQFTEHAPMTTVGAEDLPSRVVTRTQVCDMTWMPAPTDEQETEHGDQLPGWHESTAQGGELGHANVCVEQIGWVVGIPAEFIGAVPVQKQQSTCEEPPPVTVFMQTQVLDLVPAATADTPHCCP